MLKHAEMKKLSLGIASLVVAISTLLANGGAWQTGVPGTGKQKKTSAAIDLKTTAESRLRSFLVIAHDLREN